jgi:hypothetical protein
MRSKKSVVSQQSLFEKRLAWEMFCVEARQRLRKLLAALFAEIVSAQNPVQKESDHESREN